MKPTLDLFFFEIPLYSALVIAGAVVGLIGAYLFLRAQARRSARWSMFLDAALVALIAGWIGARAYHVALNWEYYLARPNEIAQIGLGGLALRGALIAGLIALALYARARRVSFLPIADAGARGLALGQAIGWLGAWVHGAHYGALNDSRFALDVPDLYGIVQTRFPFQLAESILFASLFLVLLFVATRASHAGDLVLAYLLIASPANFLLGFVRGDETIYLAGLRFDQIVDAGLCALALGGIAIQQWRIRSLIVA
ncbi:MAG: prolipoprotein diacylglyceryl transferase [Chloroflexi bacterium]|nr:prolipoprotein diacylglyceryl transferase [Chloroflexota bacterium]